MRTLQSSALPLSYLRTTSSPHNGFLSACVDVRTSVTRRAASAASVPVSLVGQDRRLSPARPEFNSRTGSSASRAPLAERSAVNRQVLGSIPSGGEYIFCFEQAVQTSTRPESRSSRTHGATAARRIPDPKVGGSNPSGLNYACVV